MKRKRSNQQEEESRLSSLLFNKSRVADQLLKKESNETEVDLKPAWIDADDTELCTTDSTSTKKEIYSVKLKQKYETLIGTPDWAKVTKKIKNAGYENNDQALRTVGHLKAKKSFELKKDILEVKKFPKINSVTGNEGPIITNVKFHPKISVAMVTGQSGLVSMFSIGGDVNNKIHSFKLKKYKVSTAQFTPDGSQAFISSKLSHDYCIYDLEKAVPKMIQLPRVIKKPIIFKISPNGIYIATSEGFDEVCIISAQSRELLKTLKNTTNVASLSFSHSSEQLYCYGVGGQVTIWDLSSFRAVKKFFDHGCVTASTMSTSQCGKFLATGSGEGIVNVYDTTKLNTANPLPLKTISSLTTKITNIEFNPTSEILSVSSSYFPDALKLVHIPSFHIFKNFPNQSNLFQVETVSFSPNSGYIALGNNKSCAYLYRLKHYKNY